jgi:hypothetical protein
MQRRHTNDMPSYAAEAIESARINGSQLVASSGLFAMLLIGMSLIEAPIPCWDGSVQQPEVRQSTLLVSSVPAFGSASMPVAQASAEPPSRTAADGASWCLRSRAPEILTSNPGGGAHPRAG